MWDVSHASSWQIFRNVYCGDFAWPAQLHRKKVMPFLSLTCPILFTDPRGALLTMGWKLLGMSKYIGSVKLSALCSGWQTMLGVSSYVESSNAFLSLRHLIIDSHICGAL